MITKIPKIPIPTIKPSLPKVIVKQMASDGFMPVIALEACVDIGRTIMGAKRGGWDEARERFTGEVGGAFFWLTGVTICNSIFEKIGQHLLKLPNIDIPIAKDEVRNPLANYLKFEKTKNGGQILEKTLSRFKFTKVVASVIVANAFIGIILPKINQAMTKWYHRNDKKTDTNKYNIPSIDKFISSNSDKKENNKNVSFGGMGLLDIANKLEHDRNWKLISVDAGNFLGHEYTSRNNDERVEWAVHDLPSIYFYMFCMPHLNKFLNKIEQNGASSSRLDPVMADFTSKYVNNYIDSKGTNGVKVDDFSKDMFGTKFEFSQNLKDKFKNTNIITLDDLTQELKNIVSAEDLPEYEKLAKQMSELQPQIRGVSILTQKQVQLLLNGGAIGNPEFLKEFFKNATGLGEFFKPKPSTAFMDKYKYIEQGTLDGYLSDLENYLKSMAEKAQKENKTELTKQYVTDFAKKNFKMNGINWGMGFAISALFLSYLIPKIQYWITKLRTGTNEFPGTEEFRK